MQGSCTPFQLKKSSVCDAHLLQIPDDLLQVVLGCDALDGRDRLAAGTLLHANVTEALASAFLVLELLEGI